MIEIYYILIGASIIVNVYCVVALYDLNLRIERIKAGIKLEQDRKFGANLRQAMRAVDEEDAVQQEWYDKLDRIGGGQ